MKKNLFTLIIVSLMPLSFANADVYVRGYWRSNGTYVWPHYRSNPDYNFYNNWSTYPNLNPYTGNLGTMRTPRCPSLYLPSTPYPRQAPKSNMRFNYTPYLWKAPTPRSRFRYKPYSRRAPIYKSRFRY